MNCNCQWTETLIALIVLIFTFWMTAWSQWIVAIAAIVLLIHAWMCKSCMMCREHAMPTSSKRKK